MAEMHALIAKHGAETATKMLGDEWRDVVPVGARVMADEAMRRSFVYGGFALTSFPYKKLPEGEVWRKEGHQVELVIDPGSIRVNGKLKRFSSPYGSYARLVLIYLQTEAKRRNSNIVPVGRSMRSFVEDNLKIAWGSETGNRVREQIHRIAACSMKFFWTGANGEDGFSATHIIKAAMFGNTGGDDRQGQLWDDHVELDEQYFKHLMRHPVALQEEAVRALHAEPVALDAYVWLVYRMRSIDNETPISWSALKEQFGVGYKDLHTFSKKFRTPLRRAIAAYPNANVELKRGGVVLRPSDPPVPPRD